MAAAPVLPSSGFSSFKRLARIRTHCGSDEIYRQRPRGIIERHVFRAFHFAPYWCERCDRRIYLRVRSSSKR
jgi:hypothetical protein